jgi:hypothetical protein
MLGLKFLAGEGSFLLVIQLEIALDRILTMKLIGRAKSALHYLIGSSKQVMICFPGAFWTREFTILRTIS